MSSLLDQDEMELDFDELLESEETPPEAFYLALRQALSQLEHHSEPAAAA